MEGLGAFCAKQKRLFFKQQLPFTLFLLKAGHFQRGKAEKLAKRNTFDMVMGRTKTKRGKERG
jgi:hypothetical protein